MSFTEAYTFLLFDSVLAELIFPLQTQLVYPAMLIFGGYSTGIIFAIALLGSLIGAAGNWYIGKLIAIARRKYTGDTPLGDNSLEKCAHLIRKWGLIVAFFCGFIPVIGSILTLIIGFFAFRFRYFLLMFCIAKALLLGLQLLY